MQETAKYTYFRKKITIKNFRYASPGSQLILDKWKIDFNTYMSSGLSYVVMEVDGSGSGGNIKTLKNTKFFLYNFLSVLSLYDFTKK